MRYDPNREKEYYSDSHKPSAAQKARDRRRKRLQQRNKELNDFGGIRWDAYDHPTLYNMIMTAKPEQLGERARSWSQLADKITGTTGEVSRVVGALMGAWRGPAAVRAAESNTRLTQWADEAGHTASKIGAGLSDYTTTIMRAQDAMPEPVYYYAERHFMSGYDVKVSGDPSGAVLLKQLTDDQAPKLEERNAAKAEAVRVMQAYSGRSQEVSQDLPVFTPKPDNQPGPAPVFPDRPGVTTPPTGPSDQYPWPPSGQDPDGPGAGATPNPGGTTPSFVGGGAPAGAGSAPGGSGGTGYGGGTGFGVGGAGGAGADGVRGPGGVSVGAGGFGRGGFGTGGGVGGPGPAEAGAGGRGVGAGGGSAAGGLAARGAAGAMAAESAMGGRGGASGMVPGMAGGAGAQGADDEEHKDKYGQGMDFLDDLPPAYPSVFGA